MKEKLIEIIGHSDPVMSEIKALEIILLFNQHIVEGINQCKASGDFEDFVRKIFIKI